MTLICCAIGGRVCCIHYLIDSTDMYLIPAQVYSALFGDNPASSPEIGGGRSSSTTTSQWNQSTPWTAPPKLWLPPQLFFWCILTGIYKLWNQRSASEFRKWRFCVCMVYERTWKGENKGNWGPVWVLRLVHGCRLDKGSCRNLICNHFSRKL